MSFRDADVEFRFGNSPAVHGVLAVKEAVTRFFDSIDKSRHRLIRTWSDDSTKVCQGRVTYTRHDQSELTLPFVNVFDMKGEKIAEYFIYADLGPLYAVSN